MLTIGQLAKRARLKTSTIRFYEQEELLEPDGRTDAGYRLYTPQAEKRLHLIQRAQRLGFSLADVRKMLQGWDAGDLSDEALIDTAEKRYLALEKRITELLVLKHELELFLRDLHQRSQRPDDEPGSAFARMLDQVCANPLSQPPATAVLEWLTQYAGCVLSSDRGQNILERLRGQHVHIWQEGSAYHILIVSDDPKVGTALEELAEMESHCEAHAREMTPELIYDDEGFILRAEGPNAFIFARLFLALEQERPG